MYRDHEHWILRVDVYGTPEGFLLYIEVPGVELEDIELEVTPLTVSVRGERKPPCRSATALGIEIQTGEFHREIRLPARVDTSDVSAELRSGVLVVGLTRKKPVTVTIPVKSKG